MNEIGNNRRTMKYLVEVKNLKKYFPIKGGILKRTVGHVKAVDGVSFTILKGKHLVSLVNLDPVNLL